MYVKDSFYLVRELSVSFEEAGKSKSPVKKSPTIAKILVWDLTLEPPSTTRLADRYHGLGF